MHRNAAGRVSFMASVAASFLLAAASVLGSEGTGAKAPAVGFATRHGKSAPLRDYRVAGPVEPRPNREIRNEMRPWKGSGATRPASDPVVQKAFGLTALDPQVQFDGGSDADNAAVLGSRVVPSDTEGDVGPNHYIQYINNIAVIYDKAGNTVLGPFPGNAFWAGLGGPCEIQNDGDPLVKYDRQADRWVFSQFALPNFPDGPFYQCFAVSTTNDPTGDYFQYEFKTSDDFFTDYGKLGVWPDAYYMSFNMFSSDSNQGGAYAFDRSAMLAGAPAGMIIFDTGPDLGVLPSDLDGPTPPPAGAPNYFLTFEVGPAALREWQFHVDWTTPANSTFSGPIDIPVAEFLWPVCDAPRSQCVPQLGSPERLETLDGDLMYRLAYRNFGDHQSLVASHTVGTEGGSAAVRWYEVRSPDAPTLYQQGTYAPDASSRWMGSIAMDRNGNIAIGYSLSSAIQHPSIGITGRLAGDPLGLMGAEDIWFAGTGSQVDSSNRWGDYSTMSVDPTDDCTFWYTQEYYASTGSFDFKTRIGAFRFPSCTGGAAGELEGTVTSGSSPLAAATVTATPSGSAPAAAGSSTTTTDESGHYQFLTLPAGTYEVTASRFGYVSASAGVVVSDGGDTVQNFVLDPAASVLVNGLVKDGSGQGWPLYAKIVVSGPSGFPGATLFTDPVTGYYGITLVASSTYDFVVTAVAPGYGAGGGPLSVPSPSSSDAPGGVVANWTLYAGAPCTAAGYGPGSFVGPLAISEGFDAGTIPAGWTVDTVSGANWKVYTGGDPCGQFDGNRTGGTGPYAILNSACDSDITNTDNSSLVTPPMDFSASTSVAIQWANDFIDLGYGSTAETDVSIDGGLSWTNVWKAPGDVPGPGNQLADMSFAAGHANVQARFHYTGFWAWWWQVDNVEIGNYACTVLPGGLVVGTVSDANTGVGLNGATVLNLPDDGSTTTFATPDDPSQGDGFYVLFAGSGPQPFEASFPAHEPATGEREIIPNSTVRLDFKLKAGVLEASPRPLSLFMSPGGAQDLTLNLTNTGTAPGSFVIQEIDVTPSSPPPGTHPTFANEADRRAALKRVPFGRMNESGARDLPAPAKAPTHVPAIAGAGNVLSSFSSGLAAGWGLVYDTSVDRLWISNPDDPFDGYAGDGLEHQYLPDGTQTGDTIDIHGSGGNWQADGTYNGRTGMLWQVNVGGDRCLFEMDPIAKTVTGKKICGPWGDVSQRAVAYDYVTNTYYVGGPNEAVVYHIDGSGTLIDSQYVGIGMVGLAYNPSTQHLFALGEAASPFNVWVLDPRHGYEILGGFVVANDGGPVLQFDAASLEPDCSGHLWINTSSAQTVYEVESGETGWCVNDIPWLSENPTSGTVPSTGGGGNRPSDPGNPLPVTVTFDSDGLLPGLRQGSLDLHDRHAGPGGPGAGRLHGALP